MGVTITNFENCDMELKYTVMHRDGKLNGAWNFPAPFYGTWVLNDARYFTGENSPLLRGRRRNNLVASTMTKTIYMS